MLLDVTLLWQMGVVSDSWRPIQAAPLLCDWQHVVLGQESVVDHLVCDLWHESSFVDRRRGALPIEELSMACCLVYPLDL